MDIGICKKDLLLSRGKGGSFSFTAQPETLPLAVKVGHLSSKNCNNVFFMARLRSNLEIWQQFQGVDQLMSLIVGIPALTRPLRTLLV